MKKTKVYRPRRGLRFTNGRRGVSPTAGFVSGPAVTRSRRFDSRSNLVGLTFTDGTSSTTTTNGVAFLHSGSLTPTAGLCSLGFKVTGSSSNGYDIFLDIVPSGSGLVGTYVETALSATFFYAVDQTTLGNFLSNFPSSRISVVSGANDPTVLFDDNGDGAFIQFTGGTDPTVTGQPFKVFNDQRPPVDTLGTSGDVQTTVLTDRFPYEPLSSVVSGSSTAIYGAISTGRNYERRKLDAILLGQTAASVPCAPFPSSIVIDANPTGTFVPPSWARVGLGQNQAFVIAALTSSNYEDRVLNALTSGTEVLETSAVPASVTLHFSKFQRFQKLTVKHTASFFDTVVPSISGAVVPQTFLPGTGTLVNFVTGNLIAGDPGHNPNKGNFRNPATFYIPVNQSGFLTDLKVWVELVHMSGGPGFTYPLGNLSVALRHPTLRWGHAYPLRNDPNLLRVYSSNGAVFNGDPDAAADFYGPNVANYFHSTFLLWEGSNYAGVRGPYDHESSVDGGFEDSRYPVWQRDRGMRVVFHDGAAVSHPRRHYRHGFVSGNFVGSPNAGVLASPSAFGFDVPWTSDKTVFPATESYQAAGSPPPGWLTGPGGTANVNEWPTTGSNYGATEIQPFLPLLDPLFAHKRITDELPVIGLFLTASDALFTPDIWRGFRPGLRGTQISGTWELLINQGIDDSLHCSAAFRQVRLEFTYETSPISNVRQHGSRRYSPRRGGARYLYTMSGSDQSNSFNPSPSASWDWYLTDIYTTDGPEGEVGRSFGLGLDAAGLVTPTGPALTYRLSGSLADIVGNTPTWLLDRFTGMPAIPESSATLVPREVVPISQGSFNQFLLPRPILDFPKSLRTVADVTNPPQTLRDLASAFTSSVAT